MCVVGAPIARYRSTAYHYKGVQKTKHIYLDIFENLNIRHFMIYLTNLWMFRIKRKMKLNQYIIHAAVRYCGYLLLCKISCLWNCHSVKRKKIELVIDLRVLYQGGGRCYSLQICAWGSSPFWGGKTMGRRSRARGSSVLKLLCLEISPADFKHFPWMLRCSWDCSCHPWQPFMFGHGNVWISYCRLSFARQVV